MKHISRCCLSLAAASVLSGCFESKTLGTEADTSRVVVPRKLDSLPIGLDEICPGNSSLADEFGDDPGWIELSNHSMDSVRLGGYRLRGRSSDGPGWKLPDTTLSPGADLMVFMSGKDISYATPARDTITAPATSAWSWADGQNVIPGNSTVVGWLFGAKKISGRLADKTLAFSFLIHLADNSGLLEWAGASVGVNFMESVDATGSDRLWFRATIPAGQPLVLRLCDDAECYKESGLPITGTGDSLGIYEIPLTSFSIDFTSISGIQFDPPTNRQGDYKLTLTTVRFFKSGHHPHSNFQLQRKGGILALEDTAGKVSIETEYPEISANGSWSRDPANGKWGYVENGTPGIANPPNQAVSILAPPAFLNPPGFQKAPLTVRVVGPLGASVRCALGGGVPTSASPLADSGIRVDSSSTVSCAAFDAAGHRGPVATGTYFINETANLPVVSVSVDPGAMFDPDTGLHSLGPNASVATPNYGANFWHETELPMHVELFESGRRSFALRAGMSIYGNWSRALAKKAFSIQLREKYGPTHVNWPLFPSHPGLAKFKGFGLRGNSSNFGSDYLRDDLMTSLTEGRNIEYQLSRHVALYLNGRYWGIYEIREKLDADYLDTRFGIDPANVDLVKNNSEVQAGSGADWNDLRHRLESLDSDDSLGWDAIGRRIDLDNFIDYIAVELFSQNSDWPANNVRCWRQRAPTTKWRMMLFDLDAGLGSFGGAYSKNPFPYAVDSALAWDAYPNGRGSNVILRGLLGRKSLRDRFINRFLVQLATNLSPRNSLRAMDSINASIKAEVPKDVARWELDEDRLASQETIIHNFLDKRPEVLRNHMRNFFKLDSLSDLALMATGGTLLIDGMAAGSNYSAPHFRGIPLTLEAVGSRGKVFMGWSDGVKAPRRTLVPTAGPISLTATFE